MATVISVGMGGLILPAKAVAQTYNLVSLPEYGGEPSIVSDGNGVLYDSSPSGNAPIWRSLDKGATWDCTIRNVSKACTGPDPSSGDDCLATDEAGAVYWCNLAGSAEITPLDADVWKSTNMGLPPWIRGINQVVGNGNICGTSCSAAGVDRQWTAAAIPAAYPATDTAHAVVVLNYHDFYGPSSIWVNISTNGGASFSGSKNVILSPTTTVDGATGAITSQGYTFCSSVPAGVGIVPRGKPHAGRIIVAWIAADPPADFTGCNVTMAAAFHTAWVSYSDDTGGTWTSQMAYDAGIGHDMSTPFVAFTLDDRGNPYIGFASPPPTNNPATCSAESAVGGTTLQNDKTCGYDMWVVWSKNQGATWNPGGGPSGTIPGSAGTAYKVNPPTETGSHWFPAIAAGDPGQVDVAYLLTPTIMPSDSIGKVLPGSCAGPAERRPGFPPACDWDLYAGQSLNLLSAPATAIWTTANLTTGVHMHQGDICNLGIACIGGRHLLDFIQETIDPTTGCAHIGYADDLTVNKLRVANQTGGCLTLSTPINPPVPERSPGVGVTPSPVDLNAGGTKQLPPTGTGDLTGLGLLMLLAGVALLGHRLRRRGRA